MWQIEVRVFQRLLVLSGLMLGLSGCASIPAPLAGDYPAFQPDQATERSVGGQVRWGGEIVDTRPGRDRTCIEILARDLGRDYRPVRGDQHYGRFLACRDGFQDPAIFSEGRDVTVIGTIEGFSDQEIGEFVYRYPRLDAETLYLWSKPPDTVVYRDIGYYDPWWPYRGYRHYYGPRTRISGSVIIRR